MESTAKKSAAESAACHSTVRICTRLLETRRRRGRLPQSVSLQQFRWQNKELGKKEVSYNVISRQL